jgi:hypothetical protein
VKVDGTTFSGNFSNQFSFKKGWSAELSGFYQSREIGGIIVANPLGAVNMAIAKQILKNKGTVKLSLRDAFFTQNFSGYSKYQNIDLTVNQNRDSRVVNIGFTYRFGKGKPTQQRKNNGANAEQSRVKSAGGN